MGLSQDDTDRQEGAATEPMSKSSVQDAFRVSLKESSNNKRASVHTPRHGQPTLFTWPFGLSGSLHVEHSADQADMRFLIQRQLPLA